MRTSSRYVEFFFHSRLNFLPVNPSLSSRNELTTHAAESYRTGGKSPPLLLPSLVGWSLNLSEAKVKGEGGDSCHPCSDPDIIGTEYQTRCGRSLLRDRKGFEFVFVMDPVDRLEDPDPVRVSSRESIQLHPQSLRARDLLWVSSWVWGFSGFLSYGLNLGIRNPG